MQAKKLDKRQSLRKRGNYLAKSEEQIKLLEKEQLCGERFVDQLKRHDLFPLKPIALEILQINLGYMCDLTCEHCHVDAGPDRKEVMSMEVLKTCLSVIDDTEIKIVDLTGGAPEMHPDFRWFVKELYARNVHTIVRSNLTILVSNKSFRELPKFMCDHGVEIIASLPCYTQANVDKQRGNKVFSRSIESLKILNQLGYGKAESGLDLHLVYNPGGAGLPGDQASLEKDYKLRLKEDWEIEFNRLYTITNLPISRFLDFILVSGRYEEYMTKLIESFNPSAAENVMCRNTISVDWQGYLYDCDFNQMLQLKVAEPGSDHISDFDKNALKNRAIVLGQHCYGCTAGAGSSCQGALI